MKSVFEDDLIKNCFLCGGNDFTTSKWLTYGDINLVQCDKCELLHLYPVEQHGSGFEKLDDEETRRQIDLLVEDDETALNHGNGILDLVEAHSSIGHGKLLDIGCKFGDLLVAAQRRGWQAEGVELNKEFCEISQARGFVIHNDTIEQMDAETKGFDVITMSHVLEHIERPDITLKSIYDRLNSGGLLYVETPNQASPIAWGIYRRRWLGVATPGHIWAFTKDTLQQVIKSAGFEIIWSNQWIPYATSDYPNTMKGQTRRFLFSIINRLGRGDIVGILAQKP